MDRPAPFSTVRSPLSGLAACIVLGLAGCGAGETTDTEADALHPNELARDDFRRTLRWHRIPPQPRVATVSPADHSPYAVEPVDGALQSQGRLLSAFHLSRFGLSGRRSDDGIPRIIAHRPDGTLDHAFGDRGILDYGPIDTPPGDSQCPESYLRTRSGVGVRFGLRAMAIDDQDRVYIADLTTRVTDPAAGCVRPKNQRRPRYAVVLRHHPDGRLDRSFGDGGIARVAVPHLRTHSEAMSLAVRPDGTVYIVGTATFYAGHNRPIAPTIFALQFDSNGAPQPFAATGQPIALLAPHPGAGLRVTAAAAASAAVQQNGRLIVAGIAIVDGLDDPANGRKSLLPYAPFLSSYHDGVRQWVVAAMTPAGTLDPSFGGGGQTIVGGNGVRAFTTSDYVGLSMLIDDRDRIYVPGGTDHRGSLRRFRADGRIDPSFAEDGLFLAGYRNDVLKTIQFETVALGHGGRIYAGGRGWDSDRNRGGYVPGPAPLVSYAPDATAGPTVNAMFRHMGDDDDGVYFIAAGGPLHAPRVFFRAHQAAFVAEACPGLRHPCGSVPSHERVPSDQITAHASSQYGPEWGPEKTLDGRQGLASKWVSAATPLGWLRYAFEGTKRISQVTVYAAGAGGEWKGYNPRGYELWVQDAPGAPFTAAFVARAPYNAVPYKDVVRMDLWPPIEAHAIRIHVGRNRADDYARIHEVDIQAAADAAELNCGDFGTVGDCDAEAPTCAWYHCSQSCWPRGTPLATACP